MTANILYSVILAVSFAWGMLFQPVKQPDAPEPNQTVKLKLATFEQLPGWDNADIQKSLQTFQISCKTFLRQNPNHPVGSQQIHMKVKDWQPACRAAMAIHPATEKKARAFFKTWFKPLEFYNDKPVNGLFTGYYLPLLHGSLTRTPEYNVPVYGLPDNMLTLNLEDFGADLPKRKLIGRIENNRIRPFYTREQINQGAISEHAPVLVWVNSHIDRLFLSIQGSGTVELPNGEHIYLGYAGENGAPYTPIGRVLADRGAFDKKAASMQGIREWLETHPEDIVPVINKNKSFVFFRLLNNTAAMGAQGVVLTPGYSLAVDRKWIPLGTPLWLDTTRPSKKSEQPRTFQRLMVAQDTGGAIRGQVRGDVFWGAGDSATYIAGKMKNEGHYWLLLPKEKADNLTKKLG